MGARWSDAAWTVGAPLLHTCVRARAALVVAVYGWNGSDGEETIKANYHVHVYRLSGLVGQKCKTMTPIYCPSTDRKTIQCEKCGTIDPPMHNEHYNATFFLICSVCNAILDQREDDFDGYQKVVD